MPIFKVVVHQIIRRWTYVKADTKEEASELVLHDQPNVDDLIDMEVESVELTELTFPE
jgi:hypothetical protein